MENGRHTNEAFNMREIIAILLRGKIYDLGRRRIGQLVNKYVTRYRTVSPRSDSDAGSSTSSKKKKINSQTSDRYDSNIDNNFI